MKKIIFIFAILFLFAPILLAQQSKPKVITLCFVKGKAINLVKPEYPPAANAVNANGEVLVYVMIDEKGNVIKAEPKSGHPLLWAVSVKAALQSKFEPILLSGKPTKVTGILVYNFIPSDSIQSKQIDNQPQENSTPKGKPIVDIARGVIIGKEIKLVKPPLVSCNCSFGKGESKVGVQIEIDEIGNIAKSSAIFGHTMLKSVSEQAARFSKFSISYIGYNPVKAKALIIYTFASKGKWTAKLVNILVKDIKVENQ